MKKSVVWVVISSITSDNPAVIMLEKLNAKHTKKPGVISSISASMILSTVQK